MVHCYSAKTCFILLCQVSVNMVTVGILLIILVVSGALADCTNEAHLFITAPKMEALSGSCLQIPCNFRLRDEQKFTSTRKTFGVWIKNDSKFDNNKDNVIFNSSGSVTKYPMSITGNLSEKNCTTLVSYLTTNYTDTYFFRVENETFKATASCDPLQVKVKESPWNPSIITSGDLKENQFVTITCSAFTPCPHSPPELTWNLQKESHNQIEENTDGTFTTKIQQTITLSDTHDGNKIRCSARYPVNEGKDTKTAETEVTLNVSYAPKQTSASISPSGSMSAGSWVNLTCSSRANPPVSSFTWFKKSRDEPVKVSDEYTYSFNATEGGIYYCLASNELGNQSSAEIQPTGTGQSSSLWLPVGGLIGLIILICIASFLWWLKSTHGASHQTQSSVLHEAVRATKNEEVHCRDTEYAKLRPRCYVDSVQYSTQQQDLVYSQVKVCNTKNSFTQTGDGSLCVYAQVQKK